MTLSEIEVQLQCAGYSQKDIEAMCIILCSSYKHLKFSAESLFKVDIFVAGGKIVKDKTGYLKGEHLDYTEIL